MIKGEGWVKCNKEDDGATPDLNAVIGKVKEPLTCLEENGSIISFGHDCPVHYLAEFWVEK